MNLRVLIASSVVFAAATFAASANGQHVIYVDHNAPPGGNGKSWNKAYNSLQDALSDGHTKGGVGPVEIWITKGNYRPDKGAGVTPLDRTASFDAV